MTKKPKKKPKMPLKVALLSLLSGCTFSTCQKPSPPPAHLNEDTPNSPIQETPTQSAKIGGKEETRKKLDGVWQKAINAIRAQDFAAIATMTHPTLGLRFCPYGHAEKEGQIVMTPDEVKDFMNVTKPLVWGEFDGSGDPISMTPKEYYDFFIYKADFANAEEINFDKIVRTGNMIDNLQEFYPGSHSVDFYFSGFEAEYAGMDWQSLRLVFVQEKEQWFLVAVVHGEWTT